MGKNQTSSFKLDGGFGVHQVDQQILNLDCAYAVPEHLNIPFKPLKCTFISMFRGWHNVCVKRRHPLVCFSPGGWSSKKPVGQMLACS